MDKKEMKEIILALITAGVTVWTTIVQNRKTREKNSKENEEIKQTVYESMDKPQS